MSQPLSPAALLRVVETWEKPLYFDGTPPDDVSLWLSRIRLGCKMRRVPRHQWADVAIYFMNGDLKDVMMSLKAYMEENGTPDWEWEAFQKMLIDICGTSTTLK